jgi:hypothetical protein
MKLYKARNGEENAAGNHVYVFVIASDHDEAEARARRAFDAQSSTDMGYVGLEGVISLEVLIEDVSVGGVSEVLVL